MEEVNNSDEINLNKLHSLSGSTLSSIGEQHQVILMLYDNYTNKENVNRYQRDFGEFWETGLTKIADVETQEELDEHIQELKRLFGHFKESLKEF
ncbi:hypothetical protein [Pontibacillus salipaludis]|uniref:hypothetical protein n=1 Tax=Pontibacillus salipaludis TaxID=1697394 RepID=UPI0031E8BBCD